MWRSKIIANAEIFKLIQIFNVLNKPTLLFSKFWEFQQSLWKKVEKIKIILMSSAYHWEL